MHGVQQLRVGRGERGKTAGLAESPRVWVEMMNTRGWRSHPLAAARTMEESTNRWTEEGPRSAARMNGLLNGQDNFHKHLLFIDKNNHS